VQSRIEQAIINAEQGRSKLSTDVLALEGMSSAKVRHFLNNLISVNSNYLEIGVWKGSTFVSALYENEFESALAIDNFSEIPDREGLKTVMQKYLSKPNVSFIENNFMNVTLDKKYNVYFYDGGHTEEDHYNAFKYINEYLTDSFVCIIDDWNWEPVKTGTRKVFTELGYKILFDIELPARFNQDIEQWWNGLYVAYINK
jgi:hypothetical protein